MSVAVIDQGLTYRGYNTLRFSQGAYIKSNIFNLKDVDKISVSFRVFATSDQSPADRLRVRFMGADGMRVSHRDFSFGAVGSDWHWYKFEDIAVPTNARLGMVEFSNPSSNQYWMGLCKVEVGAIATEFSINYEGQLTKITATGVYTGNIVANQVIITQPGGDESLPHRLVTINSNLISLGNATDTNRTDISNLKVRVSATEAFGQRITDIEAGRISLSEHTRGKIAGMNLTSRYMEFNNDGNGYLRLSTEPTHNYMITAGKSPTDITFYVHKNGEMFAKRGYIGAWKLNDNKLQSADGSVGIGLGNGNPFWAGGNFTVTKEGVVTCNQLIAKGKIEANSQSTFSGNLNDAKGTLSDAGGSFRGELKSTSGTHTGEHYGYHSGRSDGYHYGSQSGATYASSGSLGGASFGSGDSDLTISGSFETLHSANFRAGFTAVSGFISGHLHCGSFSQTSDSRKKNSVEILPKIIVEDIYNLCIKQFEMNDEPGNKHFGVIAQDVIKDQSPEFSRAVIKPGSDGFLSADYVQMTTAAIAAIQDLNGRLKEVECKCRNL